MGIQKVFQSRMDLLVDASLLQDKPSCPDIPFVLVQLIIYQFHIRGFCKVHLYPLIRFMTDFKNTAHCFLVYIGVGAVTLVFVIPINGENGSTWIIAEV